VIAPPANAVLLNGASGCLIGGTQPEARNLVAGVVTISCGDSIPIAVAEPTAMNNRVQGNFIGMDRTGTNLTFAPTGVRIANASSNLIGGVEPGAGNRIVIFQSGMMIQGSAARGNEVLGNYFDGLKRLGFWGVFIEDGASANQIGGVGFGQGNTFRTMQSGVRFSWRAGTNNSVRGNSILGNGLPVSNEDRPNDPGDADTGPNDYQNYPIITFATNCWSHTRVTGTFNSRPSLSYLLDFFASSVCRAGNRAQAETYLSSLSLETDPDGNASFALELPALPNPSFISAMATDSFGNSSEVSRCLTVSILPVNLTLSRQGASGLLIATWPTSPPECELECADSLTQPIEWRPVTNGIVDDGMLKSCLLTNDAISASQFYRLRQKL
jgi:hypothetical protein